MKKLSIIVIAIIAAIIGFFLLAVEPESWQYFFTWEALNESFWDLVLQREYNTPEQEELNNMPVA